jgi:protein TonB
MPSEPAVRLPSPAVPSPALPPYLVEDPGERRRLRVAVAVALACHLPLLLLPELGSEVIAAPEVAEPAVVLVRTPRFRPPVEPPTPLDRPPREERAMQVPIPDPTPAELEPVRELELPPPVEAPPEHFVVLPPPPPEPEVAPPEVLRVGGAIGRPRQLHAPHPVYPELARRAGVRGTVILEVRLDERGRVSEVMVLRGQRFGLTESAVAAVSRWRYEPARLGDRAVPVLMTVTINFELS